MENEKTFIADTQKLIDNCERGLRELEEMKRCKNFLIEQYNTNKRWFREESGRVLVEDIIKMSFEFGWAAKRNFDYAESER